MTIRISGALLPAVILAVAACDGGPVVEAVQAAPSRPVSPVARVAVPDPAAPVLYEQWETFAVEDGLPSNKVLAVLPDGDTTWAGTDAGLVRLRDGVVTVFGTDDGLAHRVVTALERCPDTGDLWIGTLGGLSRLSGGRFRTWRQSDSGLMNDTVYGLAVEGGRVWVATAAGLSRFDTDTGRWHLWDHTNAVFHEPWIYAVAPGDDRLWVGVWGGGVVAHDPVTGTWREYRDPDGEMELELVADDGPVHDVTSSVAFADGTLWQATYFGLSRFSGGRWRTFLESTSPLSSDFINSVFASGPRAFLATDRGLCITDGDAWTTYDHAADGTARVRTADGDSDERVTPLRSGPPHDFVYAVRATGRHVWMGTAAGLGHGWAPAAGRGLEGGGSAKSTPERSRR